VLLIQNLFSAELFLNLKLPSSRPLKVRLAPKLQSVAPMPVTSRNSLVSLKEPVLLKDTTMLMEPRLNMFLSSETSLCPSMIMSSLVRLMSKWLSGKSPEPSADNLPFQRNTRLMLKNSIKISRKELVLSKDSPFQMVPKTLMFLSSEQLKQPNSRNHL